MPDKIFVQPDGKGLAVFSTVAGIFVLADATDREVMERAARNAAEAARSRVAYEIGALVSGHAGTRGGPTWDQALESDRACGGDLFPPTTDPEGTDR